MLGEKHNETVGKGPTCKTRLVFAQRLFNLRETIDFQLKLSILVNRTGCLAQILHISRTESAEGDWYNMALIIRVINVSLSIRFVSSLRIYISELSELGAKINTAIIPLLCG